MATRKEQLDVKNKSIIEIYNKNRNQLSSEVSVFSDAFPYSEEANISNISAKGLNADQLFKLADYLSKDSEAVTKIIERWQETTGSNRFTDNNPATLNSGKLEIISDSIAGNNSDVQSSGIGVDELFVLADLVGKINKDLELNKDSERNPFEKGILEKATQALSDSSILTGENQATFFKIADVLSQVNNNLDGNKFTDDEIYRISGSFISAAQTFALNPDRGNLPKFESLDKFFLFLDNAETLRESFGIREQGRDINFLDELRNVDYFKGSIFTSSVKYNGAGSQSVQELLQQASESGNLQELFEIADRADKGNKIAPNLEQRSSSVNSNLGNTYTNSDSYDGSGKISILDAIKLIEERKANGADVNFNEFFSFVDRVNESSGKKLEDRHGDISSGILAVNEYDSNHKFNNSSGDDKGGRKIISLKRRWRQEQSFSVRQGINKHGNYENKSVQSIYYEANDYVARWMAEQPADVDPPDLTKRYAFDHTLKQLRGRAAVESNNNVDPFSAEGYAQRVRDVLLGIRSGRISYTVAMAEITASAKIAGKYKSGMNRLQSPIKEGAGIDTLMQQNLLRPDPNTSTINMGNYNDLASRFANTYRAGEQKAWSDVWVDNSAKTVNFPKGKVAGVSIAAIEEPETDGAGRPKRGTEVFSFKDEDAVFLTPDRLEQGWKRNTSLEAGVDRLQPAVGIYRESIDPDTGELGGTLGDNAGLKNQQFFPFFFTTVNRVGDQESCFLQATLAQMSEQYTPTWNTKSYFGRTEKVHTYMETDRTLDIRFIVHATEMRMLQNVWERVNWLAQQNFGEFTTGVGGVKERLTTGPILRMTIGDIFNRIPGYIRNLSYNWDHGGPGGKWEMTRGLRMPQSCEVSLSYQILHDELPDRNTNFYKGVTNHSNLKGNSMAGSRDGNKFNNLIPTQSSDGDIPYINKVAGA